jgi:hypothetical protein
MLLLAARPATAGARAGAAVSVLYLPLTQFPCVLLMQFDLGPGVSAADVTDVRAGLCGVQSALRGQFGGDLPPDTQRALTVKVVATGLGNQEPGGGGACCTGLDEAGARPFFDVLHPDWMNAPPFPYTAASHHGVTAAHEYAHGWQWWLGCLTIHERPLGDWLNEGIAHYVGHQAFIRSGLMTAEAVRTFQVNAAIATGEAEAPLQSLEDAQGLWPGHVGYLAVELLASRSPHGLLAVREVCQGVAAGEAADEAFENSMGITRADFYAQFPSYLAGLRSGMATPIP